MNRSTLRMATVPETEPINVQSNLPLSPTSKVAAATATPAATTDDYDCIISLNDSEEFKASSQALASSSSQTQTKTQPSLPTPTPTSTSTLTEAQTQTETMLPTSEMESRSPTVSPPSSPSPASNANSGASSVGIDAEPIPSHAIDPHMLAEFSVKKRPLSPSFRKELLAISTRLEQQRVGERNQRPIKRNSSPKRQELHAMIKKAQWPLPTLPAQPFVCSVPTSSRRITVLEVAVTTSASHKKGTAAAALQRSAKISVLGTKRCPQSPSKSLDTSSGHPREQAKGSSFDDPGSSREFRPATSSTDGDASTTNVPAMDLQWITTDGAKSNISSSRKAFLQNGDHPTKIVVRNPQKKNELAGFMFFQTKQSASHSSSNSSSASIIEQTLSKKRDAAKKKRSKITATLCASRPIRQGNSKRVPSKQQRMLHRKKIIHDGVSLWLQPWAACTACANPKLDVTVGGTEDYIVQRLTPPSASSKKTNATENRFSRFFRKRSAETVDSDKEPEEQQLQIMWKDRPCATLIGSMPSTSSVGTARFHLEVQPGFDGGLLSCIALMSEQLKEVVAEMA